jgi:hypothetical protein
MTKYCDIHGAVDVADDVTTCQAALTSGPCSTVLKASATDLEGNRRAAAQAAAVPIVRLDSTPNARDEATIMRQGAFLSAFGKTGRISKASLIAEVDRTTHYVWLKHDPEYSRAFDQAKRLAFQNLADEAWRRAMGEDGSVGSDRLMIKLLESLGPATGNPEYGPAVKHEHSTAPGKPFELNVSATEQLHSRVTSLITGATETPGA